MISAACPHCKILVVEGKLAVTVKEPEVRCKGPAERCRIPA
jgi:hypothetical protein